MGRYLNSQVRTDVVIVSGIINELYQITNRWNSNIKNPPKKVIKFLRTAASFAACSMRELDKELDNDEIRRIYRMADTTSFKIAYDQFVLSSKAPEVITYDITEDERDNIVEALAEVKCTDCNGKIKDCTVRTQFVKWDISPIHEITNECYQCQYLPPKVNDGRMKRV